MTSSFSGHIQRPLVAAAAVAVASFSTDKLPFHPSSSSSSSSSSRDISNFLLSPQDDNWVSHISDSKLANLSFVNKIRVPVPDVRFRVPIFGCASDLCYSSSVASSALVQNLYHSAELTCLPRPSARSHGVSNSTSEEEALYKWHLPEPKGVGSSSSEKSKTVVVVMLGWLGAKQRHLRKYAEWYTSKGYHVITFTFPMSEVLSYQPGGKAERDVHMLVNHLADWLEGEDHKNLVFHTFSNTGWLTYGVILEHLQNQDLSIMGRIRGCIVDSAPVATVDPQVFASGFSAAFLKKNSVASKGPLSSDGSGIKVSIGSNEGFGLKPAPTEAALLVILHKFFEVILHLPAVNRRLSDILSMLSTKQPGCPQLYMYSSADKVIPADSVESFVEAQRSAGHNVRACNFVSSPHVDHFRTDPKLYTSQLSQFLEECARS